VQAEAQTALRAAAGAMPADASLLQCPSDMPSRVGAAMAETMTASNLCAPTCPMARPHHEERKDALDTVA
jgi:hypothetical protein